VSWPTRKNLRTPLPRIFVGEKRTRCGRLALSPIPLALSVVFRCSALWLYIQNCGLAGRLNALEQAGNGPYLFMRGGVGRGPTNEGGIA
jgi:hypothetical protein